jgi:hypothetical protein
MEATVNWEGFDAGELELIQKIITRRYTETDQDE